MTEEQTDILVEIPDEKLPKLAALYEEKAPWAPHMVSFVHTAMKWKKSDMYKDAIVFRSPNNCWEEDGTIIATIKVYCHEIFVFTLDDQCTNLHKGLTETNLITYDANVFTIFYAIHEKHIPTVKKYLEAKKINASCTPNFIYAISPQEAKKFSIECPSDVYIKKLDCSVAKQISDVWPHRYPDSEKHIAAFIEINGGYGVFLKSTDEMVAWILKHAFGHLGVLQTEEKHKRKGYASLVLKALAKEIAEEGHWPLGTVIQSNNTSRSLVEKLGLSIIGTCAYIVIE